MTVTARTSHCGGASRSETPWIVDRFDDIKVIRYEVPGFEQLPLEEKELIYYLAEATKCGRDILFDQNFKYNLAVRRTLETVYENYEGDRTTAEWKALEKYLKKVWFANGIHHHYSNDKFVPEFTEGYLLDVIETIPEEKFGELEPAARRGLQSHFRRVALQDAPEPDCRRGPDRHFFEQLLRGCDAGRSREVLRRHGGP